MSCWVSLSEKGGEGISSSQDFHEKMVMAVLDDLNPKETKDLTRALLKLQNFFDSYGNKEKIKNITGHMIKREVHRDQ